MRQTSRVSEVPDSDWQSYGIPDVHICGNWLGEEWLDLLLFLIRYTFFIG
jgi:hypothetical protein